MLDRGFRLPIHQPDPPTPPPTAGKARLELQSPIDQRRRGSDVLAEIGEHIGNIAQDVGVISSSDLKRPASKFKTGRSVRVLVVGPPGNIEVRMADRRQTEGRPVVRVALDRLPEVLENLDDL